MIFFGVCGVGIQCCDQAKKVMKMKWKFYIYFDFCIVRLFSQSLNA